MLSPSAPRGAGILLLDGNELDRRRQFAWLEGAGYQVVAAGCIAEARQALAAGRFDLIVADLEPMRSDGIGLLLELRAACIELPVLAVSDCGFLETARAFGAAGTLRKPFGAEELLRATFGLLLRASLAHARDEAAQFGLGFGIPGASLSEQDAGAGFEAA